MLDRLRDRLTYANVMATIAAFAALATGGAYAAQQITAKDIAKNAVRAKHIKKSSVKAAKIANRAVTAAKIGAPGPPRIIGAPGQPAFSDGGQGDCIWLPGEAGIPGLGSPAFFRDQLGAVHLTGVAFAADGPGGDGACDSDEQGEDGILFRLPPELRPQRSVVFPALEGVVWVVGSTPLALGGVVFPPGAVLVRSELAPPQAVLEGVSFRPANATEPLAARADDPRASGASLPAEGLLRHP